jgi:hypothetical protein
MVDIDNPLTTFRDAVRDAVLAALDSAADEAAVPRPTDGDLPELFRAIDPLAERLYTRRWMGGGK